MRADINRFGNALRRSAVVQAALDAAPQPIFDESYHRALRTLAAAIVKNTNALRESGHEPVIAWARACLNLHDRPEVKGSRRTHGEGIDDLA